MLIGICGSICSGKSTVARYLVDHHGFRQLSVKAGHTPASQEQASSSGGEPQSPNVHHKRPPPLVFSTSDGLLEYVTQRSWDRWVTTDFISKSTLEAYSRRPFFLLISVDAPLLVRWKRYQQRRLESQQQQQQQQHHHQQQQQHEFKTFTFRGLKELNDGAAFAESMTTVGRQDGNGNGNGDGDGDDHYPAKTLEDFVTLSDTQLYHPATGQATYISTAPVRLLNTSSSLAHLYVNLGKLDLLSTERLRPSWDNYFMTLASLAARRSNCMKRRVGCVVVSRHSRRVVSTGYNGTPRGIRNCGDGGCPRCNQGLGSGHGLATCLCIHAEENALLEAGRDRLREGAVLYCDTCPCLTCSIKIAQVGISEVVYAHGYSMDGETAAVFMEAGVKLRQFVPPANGLIHLENMEFYA